MNKMEHKRLFRFLALGGRAMPTFHFNIKYSAATIMDFEDTDLESLAIARDEAILDARTMIRIAILDGYDISNMKIEICMTKVSCS